MNLRPEFRKTVGKWGHTGEGETVEICIVPPMDTIEFNLEFDVSAFEDLFFEGLFKQPEFNSMCHDGP